MERLGNLWASVFTALALYVAPAFALAQGGTGGGGAGGTGSGGALGTSPAGTTGGGTAADGGGTGWLWLLLALAVIAVVWYAMAARRRTASHTR